MTGQNDGGRNKFYSLPANVRSVDDLIRWLDLSKEERAFFIEGFNLRPNMDVCSWHEFPVWVEDVDTLNEWLGDSFYLGNFLKTFWIKRGLRHNGTSEVRELNKRKHYLERLKQKEERCM